MMFVLFLAMWKPDKQQRMRLTVAIRIYTWAQDAASDTKAVIGEIDSTSCCSVLIYLPIAEEWRGVAIYLLIAP